MFSVKGQMVSIFGLADQLIPITTTQLCFHSSKATIDNIYRNGCGCVPITLYLQKQAGGQSLLTPVLCIGQKIHQDPSTSGAIGFPSQRPWGSLM